MSSIIIYIIAIATVTSAYLLNTDKVKLNSNNNLVYSSQIETVVNTAAEIPLNKDHDLLLRALKGESVERTPVWLMRQAGRYMADFRKYSEKYSFRERSENAEIAVELSLQPWRSFGVDAVIMFSDILTPLPALNVDFTIISGKGPKILKPIRTEEDVERVGVMHDVHTQVPFLGPVIKGLRQATEGRTTLIGFIGAPFTLAAYSVEGGHNKLCAVMKTMMLERPELAHKLLQKYTDALCVYASYQVESGAQVLQLFESWAHHLPEGMWSTFAKPYAAQIATYLKARHPHVPVVYFANGGSGYLNAQLDMHCDAIAVDWQISMSRARETVGKDTVLCGNVDPLVLYGPEAGIRAAVHECIRSAGGKHVLNLGHGVEKETKEEAVAAFVNAAREISLPIVP